MTIIPLYRYEDVDTAERDRLKMQLEADLRNLASTQAELENVARDIANLIEDARDLEEIELAADQASDLAAKLRALAETNDSVEQALREMG